MPRTCALAPSRGPTSREERRWTKRRVPGKRRETEEAPGLRVRTQPLPPGRSGEAAWSPWQCEEGIP